MIQPYITKSVSFREQHLKYRIYEKKEIVCECLFQYIFFCNVVLTVSYKNIYSMALIFAQFGTFVISGTNFCDLHILMSSTRNYFFFPSQPFKLSKTFSQNFTDCLLASIISKKGYKGQVTVLTKKPRFTKGIP